MYYKVLLLRNVSKACNAIGKIEEESHRYHAA